MVEINDTPFLKSFGDRFADAQEKSGLSQIEFCKKAGISLSTFRKYRLGEINPGLTNLIRIAEIAHIDVKWLMLGDGPRDANNKLPLAQRKQLIDLCAEALLMIEEEEQKQRKRISPHVKAEMLGELVADGFEEGENEIDETNVVRFVKFAGTSADG